MTEQGVRRIGPEQRSMDSSTPGMTREQAMSMDGFWSGVVSVPPGTISGWHHHGDHTTVAYVLSGIKRLEFGPGGSELVEGRPGDFLCIGPGVVHRESNPSGEDGRTVAFRAGAGPPTINVEGPET